MKNLVNPDAPTSAGERTHYIHDEFSNQSQVKCSGFGFCEYCGFEALANRYQNHILGQVLTVLDASVHDPVQNKAIKDLIKEKFYEGFGNMEGEGRQILLNCTVHKQEVN